MPDEDVPLLSWWDVGVFILMLAISAAIGCYFGVRRGRSGGASEYLRGGRSMQALPVALSLVASHISGITVLGVPSEMYRYGTQYCMGTFMAFLVAFSVANLFVPVFVGLKLNSSYQYLEMRFSPSIRRLASLVFVIQTLLYIPIVIYVPALALSQVTGVNVHLITPITSLVCIFYTTLGGLRAVVWTDALQTALMLLSQVAVLAMGTHKLGGWPQVWATSDQGGRLELFNLDPNPLQRHTMWTVMIGTYTGWMSSIGVSQGMVQRYLSLPSLHAAKWALFYFSVGLFLSNMLSAATGLLIYATYAGCDPLSTGRVKRPDQLLPLYVIETAGHLSGFTGLFVAGVFSAALSSMSTGINALSGVLVEDLLGSHLPDCLSKGAWLRLAAASIGALCVALVLLVEQLGGVLQVALSLGSITSGPMLGLFMLGIFWPRANTRAALLGTVVSLVGTSAVVLGAQAAIASGALRHPTLPVSVDQCLVGNWTTPIPPPATSYVFPLLRLSYKYFSLLGTLLVLAVGIPASYLPGSCAVPPRPELLHPLARRLLPPAPPPSEEPEGKPLVLMASCNGHAHPEAKPVVDTPVDKH